MKVLALLFVYGQSSHGVATPRDVLCIRKSNTVFVFILGTILNAWSVTCQHRIYSGNGAESAASSSRSSRQCVPRLGSAARTSRDSPKEINMYHVRKTNANNM